MFGAPVTRAVDPHWNAGRCGDCHAVREGKVEAIPAAKVDGVCLRCHDGRAASAEAHPVGRAAPATRPIPAPSGWPLNEGRLSCVTCHEMRAACAVDAARPIEETKLLRKGTAGAEATSICERCHVAADYPRYNPHVMLTAGARGVIEEKCIACHSAMPDRASKARTGQSLLRGGDEVSLCRACHDKRHKDQFNPGHLGAKVKPEMLAFMRAREVVGLMTAPGGDLLAQLKAAGAKPTLIGLAADGTIACSTCHNPHQAGVFTAGTPLAFRPMRVVGDRAISPVHGEQWCNHCHDL
jgi:predicted CXXCH cytochrome family protein